MRSRSFSCAAAGAVAFLILMLAGCSGSDGDAGASSDELFAPGPYEVGYREFPITYTQAVTGEDREVLLRVWYPAAPDSGADPARYAVGGVVDLPSGIALDSPPVIEDDDLPFVIYSHGNGGEGLLAYPYGELMASHGWILVGPNHTGNTAFDLLDAPDSFARSALDRPNDISAVIDAFESGLADDELAGKADVENTFLFGHSFGGYTTFSTAGADVDFDELSAGCEDESSDDCDVLNDPGVEMAYRDGFMDSRIVALAPQAPALVTIPESELATLELPTMLMTGRLDQTTTQEESAEPAWAGLDGPDDIWVEMPEGAHYTFITICYALAPDILAFFGSGFAEDGCDPEFIDAEEAVPVLAAYVLAFGRRHVLGETQWDAVLEGPPLGNEGDFVVTLK